MKKQQPPKTDALIILSSVKKEAKPLLKQLKKIKSIKTLADYDAVAIRVKNLKQLKATAKEKEDKIVGIFKMGIAEISGLFKPFYTEVDTQEEIEKARMAEFMLKRGEQATKLLQEFKSGKVKKISTFAAKQEELEEKSSVSSTRDNFKLVITKASLIPKKYLVPDEKAILADLKKGVKVPGAKLEKGITIVI